MLSLTDFYRIKESSQFWPSPQSPSHIPLHTISSSDNSNDYLTKAEKHKDKLRSYDKKNPFNRLMTYENKKIIDPYNIVGKEDDAIKELNILCKNAKIATIRDKQLDERKQMENLYKRLLKNYSIKLSENISDSEKNSIYEEKPDIRLEYSLLAIYLSVFSKVLIYLPHSNIRMAFSFFGRSCSVIGLFRFVFCCTFLYPKSISNSPMSIALNSLSSIIISFSQKHLLLSLLFSSI